MPSARSLPEVAAIPNAIPDASRTALLRSALVRVDRDELGSALARSASAQLPGPKAAGNALNALRRHRDPAAVLGRPQYRAALPLLAAIVSDDCLAACIEQLGDHAEDPTKDELLDALETLRTDHPDTVLAVMLASVADSEMHASDLCIEILATDERFGLVGSSGDGAGEGSGDGADTENEYEDPPVGTEIDPETDVGDRTAPLPGPDTAVDRREERRLRRRRDAEVRRKRADASRRSLEQARRARRKRPGTPREGTWSTPTTKPAGAAPRLRRRAALTPVQEEEFARDDPWSGAVVFAWIPFDSGGTGRSDLDGKSRRCVVVAGSAEHLLVRPGYSQGGSKSRDWKAVELRGWRQAGFDQPTWIDIEMVRVERDPDVSPVGWLTPEDWNALW